MSDFPIDAAAEVNPENGFTEFWDRYFQDLNTTQFERDHYFETIKRNGFDPIVDVYPQRMFDDAGLLVPVLRLAGYLRHIHMQEDLDGMEYDFGPISHVEGIDKPVYEWVSCKIWKKDRSHPFPGRAHADEALYSTHLRPKDRLQQFALITAAKTAYPIPGMYTIADFQHSDRLPSVQINEHGVGAKVSSATVANPATSEQKFLDDILSEEVQQSVEIPSSTIAAQATSTDVGGPVQVAVQISQRDQGIIDQLVCGNYHLQSMELCTQFIELHAESPELCSRELQKVVGQLMSETSALAIDTLHEEINHASDSSDGWFGVSLEQTGDELPALNDANETMASLSSGPTLEL